MCLRNLNSLNAASGFHWQHNGVYYHTGTLELWMIFWPITQISREEPPLVSMNRIDRDSEACHGSV